MSAPCVPMNARYFSVEARMAPPPRCYHGRAFVGVGAVLSFTAACTVVVAMFNGWAYENLSHENLRPVSLPASWQV